MRATCLLTLHTLRTSSHTPSPPPRLNPVTLSHHTRRCLTRVTLLGAAAPMLSATCAAWTPTSASFCCSIRWVSVFWGGAAVGGAEGHFLGLILWGGTTPSLDPNKRVILLLNKMGECGGGLLAWGEGECSLWGGGKRVPHLVGWAVSMGGAALVELWGNCTCWGGWVGRGGGAGWGVLSFLLSCCFARVTSSTA